MFSVSYTHLMESLCRTKEIRLQMNTVSLPQMLKFDRVLIERAIMHVISNGLDYSPQGGTLYVDVQSNNGYVELSVTDEGTGFSKEALCHAQERFYMGDQSRNSKLHFGMGLYLSLIHISVFSWYEAAAWYCYCIAEQSPAFDSG